ncbi:hypothetical protein BD408DRAFT_254928 [Parasitella parasitica]|nr:hypothetical protein BD408DRAFT_254928 [Parasitella parasitica]
MTSDTFSSSLDYLLEANLKFQYNIYYDNFCAGYTREQTKAKLKHDLNECVFDIRSVANPSIQRWLQEQLENDIPLASSTQVDAFWVQLEEKKQVLEAAKNEMIRKKRHLENMHSLIMAEQAESSTSATPSIQLEEQHDHNVIEGDTLLLFNGRSISSILKSKGKRLFQNYQKLNASEKILCAYCLNGILDLSRTSLQKPLFTEEQWTFLYKTFTYNEAKHLPHLQDPTKSILAKVKKVRNITQALNKIHLTSLLYQIACGIWTIRRSLSCNSSKNSCRSLR